MKRIRHFMPLIFIVLSATSIHAMLFRALTRKAPVNPRSVRKSPQSSAFYSTATPAVAQKSNQAASLKSPTANSSWKDKLVNLYKTYAPNFFQPKATSLSVESAPAMPLQQPKIVQEPMATVMRVPIAPAKTQAKIESDEVLAKLRGKNPWNYPEGTLSNPGLVIQSSLAKKIKNFLLKNSADDIEEVFLVLIDAEKNSRGFGGYILLEDICEKNPDLTSKMFQLIQKHYDKIDWQGCLLLKIILLRLSPSQLLKAQGVIERFFAEVSPYSLIRDPRFEPVSLSKLLPEDSAKLIGLLEIVCKNIADMIKRDFAHRWNRQEDYEEMVAVIVKMFIPKMINIKIDDAILEKILGTISNNPLDLIEELKFKLGFLQEPFNAMQGYEDVPSYRHLQKYNSSIVALDFFDSVDLSRDIIPLKRLIVACCDNERKFASQYESFYHARREQYEFLSDLYDMIYEHQSGKPLIDFIFTHLVEQGTKRSEVFLEAEKQKREQLLKKGNPFSGQTKLPKDKTSTKEQLIGFGARQSLLFLNKFLFGNLNRLGSCSIDYVLENQNQGEIEFSLKEIFNMFGYGDVYSEFAKELDNLQKEHAKLSKYGEMLQIFVPKDNVDKCVYYTTSGGPKKQFYIPGAGKTKSIKTILKELEKDPQDIAEFVLINTQDKFGGLNPDSGVKIFSHNLVEQEKMAAFKEKEKELFDRIKESLKEYDREKREKEIETKKAALAIE